MSTSFEKVAQGSSQDLPDYVNGPPEDLIIYDSDQIEKIRKSSKLAAHCVRIAPEVLRPGITTSHRF